MKTFIDFNTVRNNSLLLAHRIYKIDKFVPDVIYASLRGGAYMANVISEYFKAVNEKKILYAAVVAHSYTDVCTKNDNVNIDGWTLNPDKLSNNCKIMIVDDIYDSGATLTSLAKVFLDKGFSRENIKIVVHDYKDFTNSNNIIKPDYYCVKHEINSATDNKWIHYGSHELIGLTDEEIQDYYLKDCPNLKIVFDDIRNSQPFVS